MIIILSPSKTIDQSSGRMLADYGQPYYIKESSVIASTLKRYSIAQLTELLKISKNLAELTYDRYQFWNPYHNPSNSKQALLSFKGDVFTGLDAETMTNDELAYSNDHLFILSGLYGILNSLDLIQPYRIEIAHKISIKGYKDLYQFWRKKITKRLNEVLVNDQNPVLINLASNEYFKGIIENEISSPIVTPVFKELKGDQFKVVSIYAKRARGLLTRYIIKNRLENPDEIKHFNEEGYFYNDYLSNKNEIIFTR